MAKDGSIQREPVQPAVNQFDPRIGENYHDRKVRELSRQSAEDVNTRKRPQVAKDQYKSKNNQAEQVFRSHYDVYEKKAIDEIPAEYKESVRAAGTAGVTNRGSHFFSDPTLVKFLDAVTTMKPYKIKS